VDLDLDGNAEIIYSACVYSSIDCRQLWCGGALDWYSYTAVANIDTSDPEGEVVISSPSLTTTIAVYKHTGELLWNVTDGQGGQYVSVADFDGDGTPDVGIWNENLDGVQIFQVFRGLDGHVLLSFTPPTSGCRACGGKSVSAFDFQNDGTSEFIVCDLPNCYIVSLNWFIQFNVTDPGATIISDIDLDGTADILCLGDTVKIFNSNDTWARSDGVMWNQKAFNDVNYSPLDYYPKVMTATNLFLSRPVGCPPSPSVTVSPSSRASTSTTVLQTCEPDSTNQRRLGDLRL